MNVALYPQEIFWGDKKKNIDNIIQLLPTLHPETELLILPETFSTGFLLGDKEKVRPLAERNTGATIDLLKKMAAMNNIAIAGSFVADSGGLLYNRAFFIEPNGEESFADKKHLFRFAGENEIFAQGTNRLQVRYRGYNIAVVICYDIRFPVWCRNKNCEYDLLIAVANWPHQRAAAWERLLVARAIENQAYVCGVNCCGVDNLGIEYDGNSMALDFKGDNIGVKFPDKNVIYAKLDLEKLNRFRQKFPAWKDADKFSI